MTSERAALLLARYPDLISQPRRTWERCAAHLTAADAARVAGTGCPWCPPVR